MHTSNVTANKKIIAFILAISVVIIGVTLAKVILANKLNEIVTVEAGTVEIDVSEFMKNKETIGTFVTDLSMINFNEPGDYEIEIKVGKNVYSSKLEIHDTIAPTAEIVEHEVWTNQRKVANDFVQNIKDFTEVSVSFKEEPDFSKSGLQEVWIILEDTSGNKTELKSLLNVKEDTEAPIIQGSTDQTVYIGDKVSYKRDVKVVDNSNENIELVIDSSNVNLRQVGSYEVTYSATDLAGNTATEIVTLFVKEKPAGFVTEDELNNFTDKILAKILKDDMTEVEKAWEIYKWTRTSITYVNSSDKTDWVKEAARGMQKATGDCFTYYATSRALLTRAGFENVRVNRDSDDYHAWNLVKVDGNWYHFDATPSRVGYPYIGFLRTDDEVEEYSKWCIDYNKFDKTKYPSTPIEKLEHHRKLR